MSKTDQENARRMAKQLGGLYTKTVNKFTTHLVTAIDTEKSKASDCLTLKTLKYIQAVSLGCWVVSTAWVELSLNLGEMAEPKHFEIKGDVEAPQSNGPQRSREQVNCTPRASIIKGHL